MQIGRGIDTRVFRVTSGWLDRHRLLHDGKMPYCNHCREVFYINKICFANSGRCFCINCSIIAGLVDIKDYDSWVAGLEKANRLKPETVERLIKMGILKEKSVQRLEKYVERFVHADSKAVIDTPNQTVVL